jgi:hypothetical protein
MDREKAVEECINRTRSLLLMLEKNFQKLSSCEMEFVAFPADVKKLWSAACKTSSNVGLEYLDFVWDAETSFGHWINSLVSNQL